MSFTLNADKLITALEQKAAKFLPAMEVAVKNTAKVMMSKLLERTPNPENQPVQMYQRTGRLRDGWGPAANAVGIFGSESGEGTFQFIATPSYISFTAVNSVPYAPYVEYAPGPWRLPPNAPGGPAYKGGYHFTALTLLDMEAQPRMLDEEVARAWASL